MSRDRETCGHGAWLGQETGHNGVRAIDLVFQALILVRLRDVEVEQVGQIHLATDDGLVSQRRCEDSVERQVGGGQEIVAEAERERLSGIEVVIGFNQINWLSVPTAEGKPKQTENRSQTAFSFGHETLSGLGGEGV